MNALSFVDYFVLKELDFESLVKINPNVLCNKDPNVCTEETHGVFSKVIANPFLIGKQRGKYNAHALKIRVKVQLLKRVN